MTEPISPASGLPQEAVDAAAKAIANHSGEDGGFCGGCGEPFERTTMRREKHAAAAALTAALLFLREQWEAERESYWKDRWVAAQGLHDVIAAERAKVAALQQAVDKVRALHYEAPHGAGCQECMTAYPCPTVALLPDVQAGDEGTAYVAGSDEWSFSAHVEYERFGPFTPATVVQPTGESNP